jgi:hypothetical protein
MADVITGVMPVLSTPRLFWVYRLMEALARSGQLHLAAAAAPAAVGARLRPRRRRTAPAAERAAGRGGAAPAGR